MEWEGMPIYNTLLPIDFGPDLHQIRHFPGLLNFSKQLHFWVNNQKLSVKIKSISNQGHGVIAFHGSVKISGKYYDVVGGYSVFEQGEMQLFPYNYIKSFSLESSEDEIVNE